MGQVAIYCRVSADDQSCERQERDLRAFAKRAGHKIVAVFKGDGDRCQRCAPRTRPIGADALLLTSPGLLLPSRSRTG